MARNYQFSVQGENSLLKAAGRQRKTGDCGSNETDHVVELQLVVAALNTLPCTTYNNREGWATELVDFFNGDLNLQCMRRADNQQKGQAVRKFLQGGWLEQPERNWIRSIRQHWRQIKDHLNNFSQFKQAVDGILARL